MLNSLTTDKTKRPLPITDQDTEKVDSPLMARRRKCSPEQSGRFILLQSKSHYWAY